MTKPRILNADGVVATRDETPLATSAGFVLSTDYNPEVGLGMVKVHVPTFADAIRAKWPRETAIPTGELLAFLGQPMRMLPQEARELGMAFISYSEEAIGNAITMRLMAAVTGGDLPTCVQALVNTSQRTRADQAMAYERAVRLAEQEQQLHDAPADGQVN